jgi:hypothetical protein
MLSNERFTRSSPKVCLLKLYATKHTLTEKAFSFRQGGSHCGLRLEGGSESTVCAWRAGHEVHSFRAKREQLKRKEKELCLEANARIWPRQSYMCHIRSTTATGRGRPEDQKVVVFIYICIHHQHSELPRENKATSDRLLVPLSVGNLHGIAYSRIYRF